MSDWQGWTVTLQALCLVYAKLVDYPDGWIPVTVVWYEFV